MKILSMLGTGYSETAAKKNLAGFKNLLAAIRHLNTPKYKTQHRRDGIRFLLITVFSVENAKTPTSSTGSKTQCLFGEQVRENISREDYEKSPSY